MRSPRLENPGTRNLEPRTPEPRNLGTPEPRTPEPAIGSVRYSSPMNCRYIWMNGALVEAERANVPFLTAGFHYGIGVFEGIRAYRTPRGPAVFRLDDHLKRLHASTHILGFRSLPYSVEELNVAVCETVRANGFDECYIRPFVYLADGGWNLTLDTGA